MDLRLFLFAALFAPLLAFENGYLATKVFPVSKLKVEYQHKTAPLYSFPLPCHVSDLVTLFGASHFSSTLQPYTDPDHVTENKKIDVYQNTEWYRDSLDVFVRTVNYVLTQDPQIEIEEIQTVRNYTDGFLFHRFISVANANDSQKFVIDVLNCGRVSDKGVQLQTSFSTSTYAADVNETLIDRLKKEIRESTREYGFAMTKHCTERKIHIPVSYIFLQMKDSPAFDDKNIDRNRRHPIVIGVIDGQSIPMESVARQHAYRFLFKENLFTRIKTPMVADERNTKQILGYVGAFVIFSILMITISYPSCSCCKRMKNSVSSTALAPSNTPTEASCTESSAEDQRDMRDAVVATLLARVADKECPETSDNVVIKMEDISEKDQL